MGSGLSFVPVMSHGNPFQRELIGCLTKLKEIVRLLSRRMVNNG